MSALLWIPTAALAASLLTLLSGFGLGTLLLPVFAVFFPLEAAIGLTAVVHVLNNLFKAALLWRSSDRSMVLRFGLPSIAGALAGAFALGHVGDLAPLYDGAREQVTPLALILAVLMFLFALLELVPRLSAFSFKERHLVAGGLVSGFFGGFSGHQGALRSMFLLHSGIGKEAYIATGVIIALLVDFTRIPMYLRDIDPAWLLEQRVVLTITVLAAFAGAWAGRWLIPKVTYGTVRVTVGALMIVIATGLATGVIG